MKRFLWNVRYAFSIWRMGVIDLRSAYMLAKTEDESFAEGETPLDAISIQLSYWSD